MLTVQLVFEALARVVTPARAIALGAGLAAYALLWLTSQRKTTTDFTYPQPASTLPILGNTLDLMVFHRDRVYDYYAEQSEALVRPWQVSLVGAPSFLVVSTPEVLEDVLKTHFDSFVKDDTDVPVLRDFFGTGILAVAGDVWYFHRKTASSLFTHQMMRDVMYATVCTKLATLERVLGAYAGRPEPVDVKAIISHFTSDVFGKIGFGVELACMENGLAGKPGNEFIEAFAAASVATSRRFRQPSWLWRLKRFWNVGEEKVSAESLKVVDAFIFRIICESMERKKENTAAAEGESAVPKDLISLFLSSTIKADEQLKTTAFVSEMHLIRDTVFNFIFAGKDTTSNAMAFFLVMMNRHPTVLAKIRNELQTKLPGLATGDQRVPTMDELPQLTYLEAAIRENLRLNTVAATTPRIATKDVVLSDGTPVPKGTLLSLSLYAANRRKATWGDDALEFKPERWLDAATGKLAPMSPFKAVAFLAGPRQCIGMRFAMLEMKCTLAVLLRRFEFKTVADPWSFGYQPGATVSVKGPLMVELSAVAPVVENSAKSDGSAAAAWMS